MSVLIELAADVEWPDDDAAEATRERVGERAGALATLAEWLAGAQAQCPPRVPERVRLVRFGTDDTSLPTSVAGAAGHVGVRSTTIEHTDAERAVRAGAALADDETDRGADLLVLTTPGSRRAAAVLVSVLTDTEPVKVLPRGTSMSPEHWMAAAQAIRDDRRAVFGLRGDVFQLVEAIGAPEVCATAGFLLRAAARRTPVVVDGLGATAAALVAFEVQPRTSRWWRAADTSAQPAAHIALARMAQEPVLTLATDLEDGTAGLLTADLVRSAAAIASAATGGTG